MSLIKKVYGETDDGYVKGPISTSWSTAKGTSLTNGSLYSNTATFSSSIGAWVSSGRGATSYYVFRAFLVFNVPRLGTPVKGATLWIQTSTSGGASSLPIAFGVADGFNGAVNATSDYSKVFSSGTTIVGQYSSSTETPAGNWTYMPLNSDAIAKIKIQQKSSKPFDLAVTVSADLLALGAPAATSKFTMLFASYSGTSRDPYLMVEYEDNAIFFGTNF